MIQTNTPKTVSLSKNTEIAVTFMHDLRNIDPRCKRSFQEVTTCIIRPLRGPKVTFVGVAVRNPDDYTNRRIGQRFAFARALKQMLPWEDFDKLYSQAKKIIRHWEVEEMMAEKAAEQAANDLEQEAEALKVEVPF